MKVRALYKISPVCPLCGALLESPHSPNNPTPAEELVKCGGTRPNKFPCFWEGWAAFWLEIQGDD